MNAFFKGKISPATLPKMRGVNFVYEFGVFMAALLKMAGLLGLTKPPEDEASKALLVKCYFYLLTAGIARLTNRVTKPFIIGRLKAPTAFMPSP